MISIAHAAEGAAAQPDALIPNILMIVGMLAFFYFLLWRPQSKQRKAHAELMGSLKKGDEVMISGGILGKIMTVNDDYASLEIAPNVQIKIQKSNVVHVLPKETLKSIATA